jgi:hypothetical protein
MLRMGVTSAFLAAAGVVWAQDARNAPSFNLYGLPGLIDMPTAEVAPEGTLSGTVGQIGDSTRTTLSFQITPRLSGSFRYAGIRNFDHPAATPRNDPDGRYFDRSFDLRFLLFGEAGLRPAVAIGLRDFVGTGLYGSEYVVATKTLAPGLTVTGGLGWGRLGSVNPIGSTGTRSDAILGTGGNLTADRWFRGDVAAFGGLSYAPSDRLNFKLEYSSDNYGFESTFGRMDRASPWNFGVDYRIADGAQLSLYHAYGTELGAQLTFTLNPRTFGVPGGLETAPLPVQPRAAGAASDLGWTRDPATPARAKASLKQLAAGEGLTVEGLALEARRATVRLLNPRYGAEAQAIGRTARAMTRALPASVEEFVIVPVVSGMALSAVRLQRSDVEALEHEAAAEMLARTSIVDAYGLAPPPDDGVYPKFTWGISPYLRLSFFDPDNPARVETGLRASADFEVTPNMVLSGSVTKRLAGNLDDIEDPSESGLPRVRTDFYRYNEEGDPALEYLQLALYGRPGPNLYGRFTLGYLERMYAGASAEMLWKPVDSRLALGAEINYVQRRDFDLGFGLQDNVTVDPVSGARREIPNVNGHLSAYYDFGRGFHGQLDVGRYLAGDYGATVSLDKEFANGWSVGAYATQTDVSAEDFGEGSFDKGIRFTIPLASFLGTPSRQENNVTIRSLTRDGGARLSVRGRLYDQVRDYHQPEAAKTWGRFWR